MSKTKLLLSLAAGLLPFTPIKAAGFDELSTIRVLFIDLLDASQCLQITPEDCNTLQARSANFDVSKWVGNIFCRPPQLTSCADCYNHIDGKNIIGVLPIVHEVIREPSILHTTSGSAPANLVNHRINDWSNMTSGLSYTSANFQAGTIPWFRTNDMTVLTANLKALAPASNTLTAYSTELGVTTSRNPSRAALAYTSGSKFLSVPESLLSSSITTPVVNIPFPSVVDLSAPASFFNTITNATVTGATYTFPTSGAINQVKTASTASSTTIQRADPTVSTPGWSNNTTVGFKYPAAQYNLDGDSTRLSSAHLTQCGVNYQVIPKGSVHKDFLTALATEYYRHSQTAGNLVLGSTNQARTTLGNKGTFSSATGLWSGATTYVPLNNFAQLDNSNPLNTSVVSTTLSSLLIAPAAPITRTP